MYVVSCVCPSAHLRAQSYAERLRLGLAVMHGEASPYDSEMVDGPQSPPLSRPAIGHTGLELPCKSSCWLTFFPPLCVEWMSDSHLQTFVIHSVWLILFPLQSFTLTPKHIFPLPLPSSSVALIFSSLRLLLLFMSAIWSDVVSSQLSRSVSVWLYTNVNLLLQMDFLLLSTASCSGVWKLMKSSVMFEVFF